MTAKTLMVQGTASSVGKSLIVAALCRIFRDRGLRVAPFKSQNMALNSAVTADGLEIGRAQAVQARAARIEPTMEMNPILLKPETDMMAQVVLRGRAVGSMRFGEYHERRPELVRAIEESLDALRNTFDLIVIEGAGSPAEINLKDRDIVNGFVAEMADAPVILVGDIDRGGVFASLFGTLALLDDAERARICGFIINKFRGDYDILAPALPMIEARVGRPVFGVVPFIKDLRLPEEDGMAVQDRAASPAEYGELDIAVVAFPHLSNFDDFLPLQSHPQMNVRWVETPLDILRADLAILPGTKSTMRDLDWLRRTGLDRAILARTNMQLPVLGVCGGCQMLGTDLSDPDRAESALSSATGLGLLPLQTTFERTKVTRQVRFRSRHPSFLGATGTVIEGYFIHMGRSNGAQAQALFESAREPQTFDGAISEDGNVVGTMVHGLFNASSVVDSLARWLYQRAGSRFDDSASLQADSEREYDRLARHVRESIDIDALLRLVGLDTPDR